MSENRVNVYRESLENLSNQYIPFKQATEQSVQVIKEHIEDIMQYFSDVKEKMSVKLDEAEMKLQAAQNAHDRCLNSQRYEEENDCYKPSCDMEAQIGRAHV